MRGPLLRRQARSPAGGRPNPWSSVYDPTRVPLHAMGRFARKNLNLAAQYADWLGTLVARRSEEVWPGSGVVIQRGVTPVVLYRDESGLLHERSAIGPHLGCIVAWNPGEKSWDCPATAPASRRPTRS